MLQSILLYLLFLVIKLLMSMKAKIKNTSMKPDEKKFRKWTAIKRNKDIFNIDEIDIFENIE